jgi:hypothetical protein
VAGNLQEPDLYVSDLLAFFVPARFIHFTGNTTENDAYIGLPLLLLFVAGMIAGWRTAWMRWTALTTVAVAVLSLGPHLHVNGYVTPVWLPWSAVAALPLLGSALPARLMGIGFLGVGIGVAGAAAIAIGAARAWRVTAGVLLVAGIAVILPPVPYPTASAALPAFFTSGGGIERVVPGSVVLVTPFSSKQSTDAMYWQEAANYRFRMPEGDAFTPGPYLGPHPSFIQTTLDELDAGQIVAVTPQVRAMALADLRTFGVTTIVAGPSPGSEAIVSFLTEVAGQAPVPDGGVQVWWHFTPTP